MLRAGDGPVSPWAVPNLVTMARIALVPLFAWLLLADGGAHGGLRWAAAGLFLAAISTDSLDGRLARSRNLVTDLGKLLDPIADKALTGAAFLGLSMLGELPWWVTGVVLARELGITLWRLVQARRRVVLPAGRGGKLKTVAQAVALCAALVPLWTVLGEPAHLLNTVLMSIAFALTVWSGADYIWQAYRPGARKETESP
ncbi:MAG: CDP-diacylglycerol--glycerol-3-phosphate 3-phosphatidyltransferase [Pseudoclavibacter sp.]|nr:CDP-diacylglycerol--glycerol-3-phosphate 3-phosphatidyltransferase [Pseudoclavibacter sp.]